MPSRRIIAQRLRMGRRLSSPLLACGGSAVVLRVRTGSALVDEGILWTGKGPGGTGLSRRYSGSEMMVEGRGVR